jgi:hypothetical protein
VCGAGVARAGWGGPEAEAHGEGVFGLEGEGGVVELELAQRVAQRIVLRRIRREQPAPHLANGVTLRSHHTRRTPKCRSHSTAPYIPVANYVQEIMRAHARIRASMRACACAIAAIHNPQGTQSLEGQSTYTQSLQGQSLQGQSTCTANKAYQSNSGTLYSGAVNMYCE